MQVYQICWEFPNTIMEKMSPAGQNNNREQTELVISLVFIMMNFLLCTKRRPFN